MKHFERRAGSSADHHQTSRRRRRPWQLALAALTTAAGTIVPATAAHALPVCQSATGTVYDAYQNPLSGARVAIPANGCSPTSATSDASGHFSLSVDVTAAAPTATATKTGYRSASGPLAYNPGGGGNALTLPYDIQVSASPQYAQPGQTVTYTVRTTAPPPPASDNYACTWGEDAPSNNPMPTGANVHSVPPSGTGALTGVTAVGVGDTLKGDPFYTALMSDGTVKSWGEHVSGFRGDGQTTHSWDATVTPVLGEGGVGTLSGITAIATGDDYTLALRSDGHVDGWGVNSADGGLGATPSWYSAVPFQVLGPSGTPLAGVTAIAARAGHSLALLNTGEVVEWGAVYNAGITTAHYLLDGNGSHWGTTGDPAAMIAAGSSFGVVVTRSGQTYAWGDNHAGQLGTTQDGLSSATPVTVIGLSVGTVKALAAENDLTLALLTDGHVVNWGANQVSTGTAVRGQATNVPGLLGAEDDLNQLLATALGAGSNTAFAVLPDTTLAAWGDNQWGEAGPTATNPVGTNTIPPTRMVTSAGTGWLAGVRSVSGGQATTAITRTATCGAAGSASAIVGAANSGPSFSSGTTDTGGYTTWTASVTASGADGPRSLTVCVVDRSLAPSPSPCIGTAPGVLTPTATLSYTVDGTAPDTAAGRIYPLSGGNVMAGTPQPLRIQVTDTASGVASNGVVFTLTDTTTGAVSTLTSVGRDGNWYRSANVSFADGHLYTVSAVATDRAGNSTTVAQAPSSQGGGFLGMTIPNLASSDPATTARSLASSPLKSCSVSSVDTSTLTRTITCTNVTINFPGVPVQLSGSRHGGKADLTQTVGLANLHIHPTAAGTSVGQTDIVPFPTTTQSVTQRFTTMGPFSGLTTVTTAAGSTTITQVTATVGPAVDGATIDMPPTPATATTMACTTAPLSSWCSPDPVPPVYDAGGMPVRDVIALPGGQVLGLVATTSAVVGPYGTSTTGSATLLSNTEASMQYGATPPDGNAGMLATMAGWYHAAGWSQTLDGQILDLVDQHNSLNAIANQVPTMTSTAATNPPSPDLSGCVNQTPAGKAHLKGCWARYNGNATSTEYYLGDTTWDEARVDDSYNGKVALDHVFVRNTYGVGQITDSDPKVTMDTKCDTSLTVGVSGAGVSATVSTPICEANIDPEYLQNTGYVDDYQTTWNSKSSTGSAGTQSSEEAALVKVTPAAEGPDTSFLYGATVTSQDPGCNSWICRIFW